MRHLKTYKIFESEESPEGIIETLNDMILDISDDDVFTHCYEDQGIFHITIESPFGSKYPFFSLNKYAPTINRMMHYLYSNNKILIELWINNNIDEVPPEDLQDIKGDDSPASSYDNIQGIKLTFA